MPGEIRREKQRGIQENISFRGKSLHCTRLNESLLKARSRAYGIIRKYERYTEDGIKSPNILYGVAIKGASRGGIKLSASVHSFAMRACTRECRRGTLSRMHDTVAVMHVHSEEVARLQFTRNSLPVIVYLRRRSLPAAPLPSFFSYSSLPPSPSPFSLIHGKFTRPGNKRESHATNVFPATFESRPSGDE